jgi:hypothetical protein
MRQGSGQSRREFLQRGAALGLGAGAPLASLFALAGCRAPAPRAAAGVGYGPLRPVADEATGLPLLRLPEGFRYRSFGWAGEDLGGTRMPGAHDGMGVVASAGSRCTLIRNHEVITSDGAFAAPELSYDPIASGGCVAFDFDLERGVASDFRAVLGGTLQNCAGGVTPRGSWLSCEEMTFDPRSGRDDRGQHRPELRRPHGYVFEVFADGRRAPEVIRGMGVFKHEAAATDPRSGHVYLTEDGRGPSGFFRYTPNDRDHLARGGHLHMLAVAGRPDLRTGVALGARFDVHWVAIDEPERMRSRTAEQGAAVAEQGLKAGASGFARLEGCYVHGDSIFFTSTSGGDLQRGQIWLYRPREETLTLLYEVRDRRALDYPDNLCVTPRGALLINEDNDSGRPQRIIGMDPDGRTFPFAASNVVLNGEHGFKGDYRYEEWCGVCFSPDGRWLFANCYAPGFTVAITGPWEQGPL